MLISEIKKTVQVSSGSGFLTVPCLHGELAVLSIVPSGSYEFDFRVVNLQGVVVEQEEDLDNNYLLNDKKIPIRGNATVYLENANDGDYEVYAAIIEKS